MPTLTKRSVLILSNLHLGPGRDPRTRLLARGANLRQVQELLGHVSPATTARLLQCRSTYTHINNEQRRNAVNRLAPTTTDLLE